MRRHRSVLTFACVLLSLPGALLGLWALPAMALDSTVSPLFGSAALLAIVAVACVLLNGYAWLSFLAGAQAWIADRRLGRRWPLRCGLAILSYLLVPITCGMPAGTALALLLLGLVLVAPATLLFVRLAFFHWTPSKRPALPPDPSPTPIAPPVTPPAGPPAP